jgi:hypothetical protein
MSDLMCRGYVLHPPRPAACAIDTGGFTGEAPGLYCDECAVRKLLDAPGLGYQMISLDEWRERMQPVYDDALAQLRRAKTPVLSAAPVTVTHSLMAPPPPTPEEQVAYLPAPPPRITPVRRILAIVAGFMFSLGVILILAGNGTNSGGVIYGVAGSGTSGDPVIGVGIALVIGSLLYIIVRTLINLGKIGRVAGREYKTLMGNLTPGERAAVHAAEFALLYEAQRKMREHNKAASERNAASAMGRQV